MVDILHTGTTDTRLQVTAPPLSPDPLRIMHIFRSPVGGIFRHVRDLIAEQVGVGHSVGIVCDDNTGGAFEETMLASVAPSLALGLHRTTMDRAIRPSDIGVLNRLSGTLIDLDCDILHAHGAKGGAYARLIGMRSKLSANGPKVIYCPHGGSMHFDSRSIAGRFYFALERLMGRATDQLIFVSEYERDAYATKVGMPHCGSSVVRNGLTAGEFAPVPTEPDAADFLYIGMMRDLKGPDVFLDALEQVYQTTREPLSAVMVGDGPDLAAYVERAKRLPAAVTVTFHKPMPARTAFALAHTVVVPSRAESMPYIVLEVLAAGRPLIATKTGGIPEIYGERNAGLLVQPGSVNALADAMQGDQLANAALHQRVREDFTSSVMAEGVSEAYGAALTR